MKISDIVALAKAGYKPADVLKLLEVVETSPEVKKVEAVVDPNNGDVEIKKQDGVDPQPENKDGDEGVDDITKLVNLLKEEK
jgi:hypothetical protein